MSRRNAVQAPELPAETAAVKTADAVARYRAGKKEELEHRLEGFMRTASPEEVQLLDEVLDHRDNPLHA